jgi:TatD DNase family protein
MLVDSHCHFDLIENMTPDALIAEANAQGVSHFLCVSVDKNNISTVINTANQFDTVFASVGIHPSSAENQELDIDTLCHYADNPKVIAIGETGLDYFHYQGDLTRQYARFRTHIRAAREIHKPLIIHNREATEDTLRILQEEKADEVGGIMHCFVENTEIAQRAIAMGFYISFSGIVTFKNAKILHTVAQQVPLDKILIETDSPFLAPVPHRGKVNHPVNVRYVAESIAQLRNVSVETIASATTENFFKLFTL